MGKIKNNIYEVGNDVCKAYLLTGDINVLVNTVDDIGTDVLIENIGKVLPVSELNYIALTSAFQEISGAVRELLKINPNIEIIATVAGLRNIKEMTNMAVNEKLAKDGDVLSLGNGMELEFIITPSLPWPDSMMIYEREYGFLFSGCMFAYYDLMDNHANGLESLEDYFSEHLRPHSDFVRSALDRIKPLDISRICPVSGRGIKKKHIRAAVELYEKLSESAHSERRNVALLYSSLYGSTEEMANVIEKVLEQAGIDVNVYDAMNGFDYDDIRSIETADAIIAGTWTHERNADTILLGMIIELDVNAVSGKPFFVFGSYGWSGEGAEILHSLLSQMRMKAYSKPFTSIFRLSDEKKDELIAHTQKFVEKAL